MSCPTELVIPYPHNPLQTGDRQQLPPLNFLQKDVLEYVPPSEPHFQPFESVLQKAEPCLHKSLTPYNRPADSPHIPLPGCTQEKQKLMSAQRCVHTRPGPGPLYLMSQYL